MEEIMKHLNDCTVDSERIYGWLEDEDMLEKLLYDFRVTSGITFVTRSSRAEDRNGYKNEDGGVNKSTRFLFHLKSKVLTVPCLPFPFTCGKYIMKDCVYGRCYQSWGNKIRKKKERENLLPLEHAGYSRPSNNIRKRTTKKIECKAAMYIKEIIIYPKYSVDVQDGMKPYHILQAKKAVIDKLKNDIAMRIEIEKKSRFYVALPLHSTHNHVIEISNPSQPLNTNGIDNEDKLVSEGVSDVIEDGSVFVGDVAVDYYYSSSVDGSDIDLMSTSDNTLLASHQEIHAELDLIRDVSYLCTDVGVLRQCIDSLKDIGDQLSKNTLKYGLTPSECQLVLHPSHNEANK